MSYSSITDRLQPIRLLAMDVDGVLTEGQVTWTTDNQGRLLETKSFSARDGLGLTLVQTSGLRVAWITGRVSPVVRKRAEELGVTDVCQWARNKRRILEQLTSRLNFSPEQTLYIGDDLNDLPAFQAAGVRVAVADAAAEVRAAADWVTEATGGRGAVREVVEGVLKAQGRWEEAVAAFLRKLEAEQDTPPPAQ